VRRSSIALVALAMAAIVAVGYGRSALGPRPSTHRPGVTDPALLRAGPAEPLARLDALEIPLRPGVRTIAFGAGSVWVGNVSEATVSQIAPTSGKVLATIEVPERIGSLAFGADALWISGYGGSLFKLVPGGREVDRVLRFGDEARVVFGGGNLWVLHDDASISAVHARKVRTTSTVEVQQVAGAYRVGAFPAVYHRGALWVTHGLDRLSRVTSGRPPRVEALPGRYASRLIPGEDRLWLVSYDAAQNEGSIERVLPDGGLEVTARGPLNVAVGAERGGTLWLRPADGGTLLRVVPSASRMDSYRVPDSGYPGDLAIGFGYLWVTDVSSGAVYRIPLER
jgi:hypothetical protein